MTKGLSLLPFDLLLITDGGSELTSRVRQALAVEESSRIAVLLRDKSASARSLLETALTLREITLQRGARLLVSDRLDVAQLASADGVHLPESGVAIAQARRLLGQRALIGASRHDRAGLLAAQHDGASYATLSPVYASPNKGTPIGVQAFAEAVRECRLPVFALGGVTTSHVPELVRAGAAGVAVIREVMAASNPAAAVRDLRAALRAQTTVSQSYDSLAPTRAPG